MGLVSQESQTGPTIDVGYQTGINTQWMGETNVVTNFQQIVSSTYTTNSDGETWTLADLNNGG